MNVYEHDNNALFTNRQRTRLFTSNNYIIVQLKCNNNNKTYRFSFLYYYNIYK